MTVVDLPSGSINSRRAERIMTFLNWSRQCLLCVCLLIFVKESTYSPPGVNMKAKIKTETNKNPNLFQPQAVKTQMANLLKCMHMCKTPFNPVQIYSSIQQLYCEHCEVSFKSGKQSSQCMALQWSKNHFALALISSRFWMLHTVFIHFS